MARTTSSAASGTQTQTETLRTTRSRRRASSLLGDEIPGDNAAPAMSTMPRSPASRQASKNRRRKLSSKRERGDLVPGPNNFIMWYREMSYTYTWLNPLIAMLTMSAVYLANPTPSNPMHDFIFLSYPVGKSPEGYTLYSKGINDAKILVFYTIFFTFTREFLMQQVLRPLSQKVLPPATRGNKGTVDRFMEQGYTAMYFGVMGPFGLYVMRTTPGLWYFETASFWSTYPNKIHTGLFKAYYLLQWSYWLQQAIVLLMLLEKPRKDFKELVIHHVVTLILVFNGWKFHFTYIGLAVFITHDVSDFFLATSKVLNYVDSKITGPYFVFFVGTWIYLRHYLNFWFLWSCIREMPFIGDFRLDWEGQYYKCTLGQYVMVGLLSGLQAVNIFWLFLIGRVGYRYVFKSDLQDVRSEDEDDDEVETPLVEKTPTIQLNGESFPEKPLTATVGSKANGTTKKRTKA